jgi:dihydroxy-acid dehydratase
MTRTLRSNFEPGSTRWAVRRAQWRALGISPADMTKPKIAVVNSSSSLSSCYSHLDKLSATVQAAIRSAGGLPFEVRTVAPSDFITSAGRQARYILSARDLLVNDIEVMVEGALLDGMVCLASCDKTTPAQLMAAARLNLPTILVIGGYQATGFCGGRSVDIDDVYESVGAHATGELSLQDMCALADAAITGPGVCAGLGTANSMHLMAEALGMTLPGSAPVAAGSAQMVRLAADAGRRVIAMVEEDLRPRDILTPAAFRNAATLAVAVGGSVNCVRHLAAISAEAGLELDVIALIEKLGADTPLLTAVRPNGSHTVAQLDQAGGAGTVLKSLRDRIDLTVPTVSGAALGEQLASAADPDGSIVRNVDDPFADSGGLVVLRGSLAPDGALAKVSAFGGGTRRFAGQARVFADERTAIAAIADGRLREGDVAVLRGLGPRGGPGTVFAAGFVAALVGAGLSGRVAVVTDGELSGLNRGIVVGQVMPEAADGGPLALVENGDQIVIALDERRLDLAVDTSELRRREPQAPVPAPPGWLSIYRSAVQPIQCGAVLGSGSRTRGLDQW